MVQAVDNAAACPGEVPYSGRSLAEIEVFDPEAKGFHDAQAGAIHELGGEFPRIIKTGDDGADLLAGHDDGRAAGTAGGRGLFKGEFADVEDLAGEEDEGVECLLLGGDGDVAFEREIIEVSGDGGRAGSGGVLCEFLEAEADETGGPVDIGFLGGDGEVLEADGAAEGVDEAGEFGGGSVSG